MAFMKKLRRVADYCFGFDIVTRPNKARIFSALTGWIMISLVIFGLYLADIASFRNLVNLTTLLAFAFSLNAFGLGFREAGFRNPAWIIAFSFFWHQKVVPYFPMLAPISS